MDYSNQNRNNTNIVTDEGLKEVLQLENKLVSSRVPDALKEESMRSVNRLKRMFQMGAYSAEFENVNKYIDWVTRIPWGVLSEDRLDISNG